MRVIKGFPFNFDLELDVHYTIERGTPATYEHPGDPTEIIINDVEYKGKSIYEMLVATKQLDKFHKLFEDDLNNS